MSQAASPGVSQTTIAYEHYRVETASGPDLPAMLLALRRDIYESELGYLTPKTLKNKDDKLGVHIFLVDTRQERAVACAHVYPAEHGEFADHSGLSTRQLAKGVYITRVMTAKELRGQGLLKMMLYLACRQGRLWGRERMFCFAAPDEKPTSQVLRYELLPQLPVRVVKGSDGKDFHFLPGTQHLDFALTRAWECMPAAMQAFVQPLLVEEAVATTEARIKTFFENPWFKHIQAGTFTRNHYIQTLGNWHQFVRLTTRILARATTLSEPAFLRRHFIQHMNGEIDHEVQVETDLRALKAEVDYVRCQMIPNRATQKFMVIQESVLGFNSDPVSFLAVPFGIEGFSAHLDEEFVNTLENNIRSWGVKNPRKATTFLRAHIVSDGGDDGHWQANKEILRKVLSSELVLRKFLNVTHLTFDAMEECYASWVSEDDYTSTLSSALSPLSITKHPLKDVA